MFAPKKMSISLYLTMFLFLFLFAQNSAAQCEQLFTGKIFPGYFDPNWMAKGDVDNDGDMDFVTTRSFFYVTVVFNDGRGNFENVGLPVEGTVRGMSVVDVDGDSNLDIVVPGSSPISRVWLMFGNGDGSFTEPHEIVRTPGAFEVECHDFNHDDKVDIVVTTRNGIEILLGLGNREFAPPTIVNTFGQDTASVWQSLAVGDFNGDANLDLARLDRSVGYWQVLLGKGNGEFSPATVYHHGGSEAFWLTPGDLNNDSIIDMVVASRPPTVWLGLGDGKFELVDELSDNGALGTLILGIETGDFNSDGALDLAMANHLSDGVEIYLGDGDGQFSFDRFLPGSQKPLGNAWDVVVDDFNGNGKLDVVSGHYAEIVAHYDLFSSQEEVFELALISSSEIQNGRLCDVNGDGSLDFVLFYPQIGHVYLGTKRGEFVFTHELALGNSSKAVAVADFNGDLNTDLAITDYEDGNVSIFVGNNDGTFQLDGMIQVGGLADNMTTADFDDDGDIDLAVTSEGFSAGYVSILWNNGAGQFYPEVLHNLVGDNQAQTMLNWDLGQDGDEDLLIATRNVIMLMKNNGSGEFAAEWSIYQFDDALFGDFNNDGIADLLTRDRDSIDIDLLSVYLGDGTCGFIESDSQPIDAMFRPVSVVADIDQDGIADGIFHEAELDNRDIQPVLTIMHGSEDGPFEAPAGYVLKNVTRSQYLHDIAVSDIDGDSDFDLIHIGQRSVTIAPNRCAGSFQLGDVNRDGTVSLLDVPALIEVLISGAYQLEADVNLDGFVNQLDVAPFIDLLVP